MSLTAPGKGLDFACKKSEPSREKRRPIRDRREVSPMGIVIDCEAHAWLRVPGDWRWPLPPDGSPRTKLRRGQAGNYQPGRPNEDGSYPKAEENSADLIAAMDRYGVDISIIYPGPFMVPNDEIARVQALAPDRLIGFAKHGIHVPPWRNEKEAQAAMDELEHGLRDLKLRGVAELSLNPWHPEDPATAIKKMYPYFELCRRYRVPAIVHCYAAKTKSHSAHANPAVYKPVADDFPDVPLIIAHMGGVRREFFDAALDLARTHDNVFCNTSMTYPEFVSEAVRKMGAERVFFGCDWHAVDEPETEETSQHRFQISLVEKAPMTDRERELVMGEGIAALLGLKSH
jgi:predicted TIM-barrel fold metal-dependent hydrolase